MHTLLIPTDFSENAIPAMKMAIALTQKADINLIFLHIADPVKPGDAEVKIAQIAKAKMVEIVETLYKEAGFTFSPEKVSFEVSISFLIHETIAARADKQADMIIMGTHGASGVSRVLMGSNAVGVIEKSSVPVLTVPVGYHYKDIRSIAYASDLLKMKEEMPHIVGFAKIFQANIDIFHVFPVYPQEIEIEKIDNIDFVEKLKKDYNYNLISLHFVNTGKENRITEGIEIYIKCYKPDIVATVMKKRGWLDKMLDSSKTEELVFEAKIPLLALKGK
jgi:nucleotide-binding universal stress UspA family protein